MIPSMNSVLPVTRMAQNGRIVMVPYPFQGHINPMLQLATVLHSKGFSITIVHPQYNSPNPTTHPNFTFVPIADGLTGFDFAQMDIVGPMLALNRNCEVPLKQYMEQLGRDERVACIIYDTFMNFAQKVATELNLPGITVRTSAAASLFAFSAVSHHDEGGFVHLLDSISHDQVPELQALGFNDLVHSMMKNSTHTLLKLRAAITDSMRKSSAIVVNTVHFLECGILNKLQEVFSTKIFPIGPFHKLAPSSSSSLLEEDTDCITWLDEQAPGSVLYVSFGSIASMDEQDLLETARGLALSGQPFLWVVRPGSVRESEWLEPLPDDLRGTLKERGRIVKWAPQKEVLAHRATGGFWTHCGWNSTLESIGEGVPMICLPFFGDQALNARYVCRVWKVGLELEKENANAEKIAEAIRRLMVESEGEEIKKRALEFKAETQLNLKSGGSSDNSVNELVEHISFLNPIQKE